MEVSFLNANLCIKPLSDVATTRRCKYKNQTPKYKNNYGYKILN